MKQRRTNYLTEYESEQAGAMLSQIIGSTIPNDTTLADFIAARPPANAMAMGDSGIVLTNNVYGASRTNVDRQATLVHELMHLTFRSVTSNLGLQITGHRGLARALGLPTLPFGTGFDLEESYASGQISGWIAGCLKK